MAAPLTSGDMLTENIGISDDPEDQMMILNVLTNTLYTDKLAAVLREYGCNGADANVEAGKGDQPIEVRLPNKLNPTLAIRDYGFGMTQDQVIKVFCRLGKSTKRGSNAFTGMLGIGSKAGFAYGDQFMVTSFSGGTRTIYNAFRDKGIPKLAKMHSEATDEPDGIEVKVPVRAEDMAEFTSKAERVYRYFRVRPTILGANINWQDRSQEFSGTGWRFLGRGQQSVAIMGNVGYALDATALGVSSESQFSWQTFDNNPPEGALLNLGIELDFNIGDLEVAANREGLQYDDETKKALLAKIKIVVDEIGKIMSSKISGFPSMWEAKKQYHTLFEGLSSVNHYDLNRVIGTSITWGGKTVDSAKIILESIPVDPDVSITRFARRGSTYLGSIKFRIDLYPRSIEASNNISLVINDLPSKKNAPARMRGHFAANPNVSYIVVFAFQTTKAQTDYWKAHDLDGAPTINLSAIAPQVIASQGGYTTSAHKSKHSAKVFVLDEKGNHTGRTNSLWWNTEAVDLKKDGGVYVRIESFQVKNPNGGLDYPSAFAHVVKKLRDAGMISGPVYGFKTDRIPKLGPKWIPFKDSLKTKMDTLVTKDGFAQEIADFLAVSAYKPLLPDSCVKMFPSASSVRNLLDEQARMRKPRQKKLLELVESGDADGWLDKPTVPAASVNLNALEMIVYNDYPMIKLAACRMGYVKLEALDPIVIKQIADYVKLTDK